MSGDLRSLEDSLKANYFSPPDNIAESLYKPCLRACSNGRFYRGAGYFRSAVLSLLDKDLIEFCIRGGKMSLLTSTDIKIKDREAALEGYSLRSLNRTLEEMLEDQDTAKPTRLLCALVASGKLEIHVAILPSGYIYHDKMGFFQDTEGNTVAFAGSGNESLTALHPDGSFERFSVSCSWEDCYGKYGGVWKRVLKDAIDFHDFEGAEILTLDKIDPQILERHDISEDIGSYIPKAHKSEYFDYGKIHEDGPQSHQLEALRMWVENDYRAGLQHATGTYKTATGLLAAEESLKKGLNNVVITSPRILISDNWSVLARKSFSPNVNIIQCWSEHSGWHNRALDAINSGGKNIFIFVNKSLWQDKGRVVCRSMGKSWGLVVDEAHNWEKDEARDFMQEFDPMHRIGLSAQFADPRNPTAIDRVMRYLAHGKKGVEVDDLHLGDAIEMGFLREYEYELKDIEIEERPARNIRKKAIDILTRFEQEKKTRTASDSVELLKEGKKRVLSFTGRTTDDAENMMRDIQDEWDSNSGVPIDFRKVTCKEDKADRNRIITEFNYGRVRGLVAINVLDEGVDLPVADAAVMATSKRDHRQWIQRRGRILRKRELSDTSKAKIIDYVLNLSNYDDALISEIKDLRAQDLERIVEFAKSALDESQAGVVSTMKRTRWM